jgi:hypothetical protein
MPGLASMEILLFVLPLIAGMSGMRHFAHPLVDGVRGALVNFAGLALNHDPSE